MRRLVAIQIKGGVAVSLWALGALCLAAEARQPGFWYDNVNRLTGKSGDRVIRRSGDLSQTLDSDVVSQSVPESQGSVANSPEPAYQSNEVAAEQQAAE